jgi:aspartate/methionine/tyrosine aminotransferase
MELEAECKPVRSPVSRRASLLLPSAIIKLSQLAQQRNAINLAEGFPDFPAPQSFKDAAIAAINANHNQYKHLQGLCDEVAAQFEGSQGMRVDPCTEVTICCGQSEALVAAVLAVIDEDDEVILLDPSYETYEASILLAGGKAKHVSMVPPFWTLDLQKLHNAMGPKTKAVIVNSPHNPTGKVLHDEELAGIAKLCCHIDCLAITDEVYQHISFTGKAHKSLASFPGMKERTIATSSISKTFRVTGWRVGWAIASETITCAINRIHQKLTDSAPAPFQVAALAALASSPDYYVELRKEYTRRRNFVCDMLQEAGFHVRFNQRAPSSYLQSFQRLVP